MTTPATPSPAECAFCRRPIGDYFYKVSDLGACDSCASHVFQLQSFNFPRSENLAGGFAMGLAAAIGSALGWAAIAQMTGKELGILAWGVGLIVAKAVLQGARKHRGRKIQILAMSLAAAGIVLGKLMFLFVLFRQDMIGHGANPTVGEVLRVVFLVIRNDAQAIVQPFDLVWFGIALYTAWRMCAPFRVTISGPFGEGAASAPAYQSTFEHVKTAGERHETPLSILLKTGGSMLLSIIAYQWYAGWEFAIGFVLLILVHEMGHVIANRHYGIRSSPPIFIPFLGAVIALRQQFPDAKVEAISALAGPVAGTIGSIATLGFYFYSRDTLLLELAGFGFMMNLFNLLPLPPLDGGRVMAAVNPWVWILGLVGMGALVINSWQRGHDISVLMIMVIIALPRVIFTLRNAAARTDAYYRIHQMTSLLIGASYLALLIILIGMTWYAKTLGAPVFV